jgi:hypothetical protein
VAAVITLEGRSAMRNIYHRHISTTGWRFYLQRRNLYRQVYATNGVALYTIIERRDLVLNGGHHTGADLYLSRCAVKRYGCQTNGNQKNVSHNYEILVIK